MNRSGTQTPSTQILAIDLIRFACAVAVMTFHYTAAFPVVPDAPFAVIAPDVALPGGARPVVAYGWVGVEIFFVVSGYVIAMSSAGVSAGAFVRRRVLRLAPAAWLCATLTAAVLLLAGAYPAPTIEARWLAAVVFVPMRHPLDPSWWTLFAEVCFYALVAATIALGGGRRAIRTVTALLGLTCVAYWIATLIFGREAGVLAQVPNVVRYGAFFALGNLAWTIRGGDASRRTLMLATVFAITGAIEITACAYATAQSLKVTAWPSAPVAAFALACTAILFADRLQPVLARTLGAQRLAMLGLTTYPLYLLHQSIGAVWIAAAVRAGIPGYAAMAGVALTMIALAWGVTRYVEPRLRRAVARAIDRLALRSLPFPA